MSDLPASFRDLPVRAFPDRAALEDWLASNSDAVGLWLAFAKKGSGEETVSKAEAIEAALCHGWIDGQLQPFDDRFWLIRFTPRRARSIWSQVNRHTAERLIADGRMRPAGLAEIEQAKADGRWNAAYQSASSATIPNDLQEALDADPAARAFFATLKGASRYAVLHRVGQAKKPDTRAARIAKFVAMLARGETLY